MKPVPLEARAYRIPFREPLRIGEHSLTHREGFLLKAQARGSIGRGEAAPAWWIGESSLASTSLELEALTSLDGGATGAALARMLEAPQRPNAHPERDQLRSRIEQTHHDLTGQCGRAIGPAVRSALQSALLDLAGRHFGIPGWAILAPPTTMPREVATSPTLPLAGLLAGESPSRLAEHARKASARGYETLKIKVGARPVALDIERVRAVLRATPASVRLRLDANRSFCLEEFQDFSAGVCDPRIEFLEEPLAVDPGCDLALLQTRRHIPVALDESITSSFDLERSAAAKMCDAVILKNARLGGPLQTQKLAWRARELGLRVVLTDSLETAVGQASALHVAVAVCDPTTAIGLGGATTLARESAATGSPRVQACGPGFELRAEETGS